MPERGGQRPRETRTWGSFIQPLPQLTPCPLHTTPHRQTWPGRSPPGAACRTLPRAGGRRSRSAWSPSVSPAGPLEGGGGRGLKASAKGWARWPLPNIVGLHRPNRGAQPSHRPPLALPPSPGGSASSGARWLSPPRLPQQPRHRLPFFSVPPWPLGCQWVSLPSPPNHLHGLLRAPTRAQTAFCFQRGMPRRETKSYPSPHPGRRSGGHP